MKNSEIAEGNKLIAEFLGAYPHEDRIDADVLEYELYGILECIEDGEFEQHFFHPEEMKFHESWDWLMPVIEKIEMHRRWCDEDYDLIINSIPKIEATYLFVIEFIRSYNRQI